MKLSIPAYPIDALKPPKRKQQKPPSRPGQGRRKRVVKENLTAQTRGKR